MVVRFRSLTELDHILTEQLVFEHGKDKTWRLCAPLLLSCCSLVSIDRLYFPHRADTLDIVMYRVGVLAALRSIFTGKVTPILHSEAVPLI